MYDTGIYSVFIVLRLA